MRQLIAFVAFAFAPLGARADGDAVLLAPSIWIECKEHHSFFRSPKGPEDNGTWSWTPHVQLDMEGALPDGTVLTAEFLKGKTVWREVVLHEQQHRKLVYTFEGGDVAEDREGVTTTGPIPFQIRMKNPLTSVDKVLFKGTADVKKIFVKDDPKKKNTFDYYVDYSGNLPLGFVQLDVDGDPNAPDLTVGMWLAGKQGRGTKAFVLFDGKPIASTEEEGLRGFSVEAGRGEKPTDRVAWDYRYYYFSRVRATAKRPDELSSDVTVLDKKPGDYEVKVMSGAKVIRSTKFTVGADGKITDGGLAAKLGLGARWAVLPIKVLVDGDGVKVDKLAWKKGALYGNPPDGFAAP
jgi:hypothetical protein